MAFKLENPCTFFAGLEQASAYLDKRDLWFGHGTDNSWDESVVLLLWAAGLPMDSSPAILERQIPLGILSVFERAINTRVDQRKPAVYMTNEGWFCGLPFYINESVLIPRSPISELINNSYLPWFAGTPTSILDLCCGSGCIGIAAALASPDTESIVLSDLSQKAVDIAQKNIRKHRCADRVSAVCADLFEGVAGKQFDLILSNPPYVDIQDINAMPKEYLHEPEMGLGSGNDGLDISRKILARASQHLSTNGLLILEVGNSWKSLEQAYPNFPFIWLEFENGGHGVCALTKPELLELNRN